MNVAIDLDGVIIDNYPYWREYFVENEKVHNHSIKNKDLALWAAPTWDYLQRICRKCWNECLHSPRFILGYEPRPEAVATLEWFSNTGITLHLITNRPPDVDTMTYKWLSQKGLLNLFKSVRIVTDKVPVAESLNCSYMLDDAPHNILAFEKSSCQCLIWDAPYNKHLKGHRVYTWNQVNNILIPAFYNISFEHNRDFSYA